MAFVITFAATKQTTNMAHQHEHHSHAHCNCSEDSHQHPATDEHSSWWRPALSLAMLAAGIIMNAAGTGWFEPRWVQLAWYAVAFLPVGIGVIVEAVQAARQGDVFSEFLLMSVAALGAFAIGEFPEAVAVMTFYCIGEALQDRAVDRARRNIQSLLAFRPDHATVVDGDSVRTVAPEQVQVGDLIEVKPGERVPVDGTLTGHAAALDTAALTGESVPRTIEAGGEVLAGMIATDSVLRLRATRPASESAVSRILNLVENASERKSSTELFIRRFARVYTPIVVGIAVLLAVVPWAMSLMPAATVDVAQWVKRALIFLVISCPCALVISIPLSYFAGIGAASRRGILFKGGNYLDALAAVDTVAFDKTGTLTTGQFAVSQVVGLTDAQLDIVAAIERDSSHPIARAIIAHHRGGDDVTVSGLKNIAGYGLEATAPDGTPWLVGTTRLLTQHGVAVPDALTQTAQTLVACAAGGQYVGHLLLSDTPKEDAARAIAALKQRGVHTTVLSGDKQALVQQVAGTLHADDARGDLLPQDKAAHIQQLQQQGHKVAMVGDGINDAPVLATSDVGIAMGTLGSDMAIETADVVIQTDQPSRVADAIAISQRTRRIAKQNIALALVIKVAVMALGALGVANLWEAVFADVGVALLCVLNSLRLMR